MGGIVALVIGFIAALTYLWGRKKKTTSPENSDDIQPGAAWILTALATLMMSFFVLFPWIMGFLEEFQNPLKTILAIIVICLLFMTSWYIPKWIVFGTKTKKEK